MSSCPTRVLNISLRTQTSTRKPCYKLPDSLSFDRTLSNTFGNSCRRSLLKIQPDPRDALNLLLEIKTDQLVSAFREPEGALSLGNCCL